MNWTLFIRIVIFITFLLLLAEGIAAVFLARKALEIYIRKHKDLEIRQRSLERRLKLIEEHLGMVAPEDKEQ